ncbi:MAG: DUF892 family protein [Thermodesulfobacteriota bacterium]
MKKKLFKNDLERLFNSDLKHLYYVEKESARALVRIQKSMNNPDIVEVNEFALEHTVLNRIRIEEIFDNMETKPRGKKSRGIDGIIGESKEIIQKSEKLTYVIVDAALLTVILRILSYKTSAYKTLISYAKLLDNDFAASLLHSCYTDNLITEKKISLKLNKRVKTKEVKLF